MKKTLFGFMFAVALGVSMISCGGAATSEAAEADSTVVDSVEAAVVENDSTDVLDVEDVVVVDGATDVEE